MRPLHAIVFGLGSAGDVHPNVGLGMALRRRGHEVTLVAPAVFHSLAERCGLSFVEAISEEEYNEILRDPDLWHPYRAFPLIMRRLIVPGVRRMYEGIKQVYEPGRTVLAAPGTAPGARIAQEKLGVPLATIHLQPVMLRSVVQPACFGFPDVIGHLPPALRKLYFRAADWLLIDRLGGKEINRFRAELGLAPVTRFLHQWIHSPQLIIGLFPEWFAPPQPDWPPKVALTGFPLWDEREMRSASPELEAFLAAGDPPIAFTAGSAMMQGKEFFRVSAEVCRASGRRGLLLTQFAEQLPKVLPKGVWHFDYVPFSQVLPRCAAIVHHGGIGTTAQAIAAGIPQLVVPAAHDQPDNAMRVRRLGLGEFILPKRYTVLRVMEELKELERAEIKENCRRRAAEAAGGQSLERAAELIERLADKSAGVTLTEAQGAGTGAVR